MALSIELVDATLGAIVTEVDLARMSNFDWYLIHDAFLENGVLVFPGQNLSDQQQVKFGCRFGEILELRENYKIVSISNQRADGSLMRDEEHHMQIMRGNEGWHTDSSYMSLSAKASILSAHVVPSQGGQTEWADMRAAYDKLDEDLKEKIANLSAFHSLTYSQAQIGHATKKNASYGLHEENPPRRSLVKVHPETGRPALYIGRHAYGIPGMSEDDSKIFLQQLMDFACQPPRTFMHEWGVGDIVVWDNRCVMHRARPYDHSEARVMAHTRIAGDPRSETALCS